MASNSEICLKCKCKCILVSLEDIYCNTNLTAASNLLTAKAHVFNKVHSIILKPILGDCLEEICKAKYTAIEEAKANGGEWTDYIDAEYLELLQDEDFIYMYANYVEYYVACAANINYECEGLKEYDRTLEGGAGISRHISEKKEDRIKAQILCDAKIFKKRFEENLECFNLDCLPNNESCNPCETKYKPRRMHFAKSDRR